MAKVKNQVLRMVQCESEMIKEFGYQESLKKLTVVMKKDNSVYTYNDVPTTKFFRMCEAESIGEFFNDKIKGKYSSDKVSD